MNRIIGVDVDDVILDLVPHWLSFYNRDYNDNLKSHQVLKWEISNYVKCGNKIYDYLVPEIYKEVSACDNSLSGISFLNHLGYKTIFVTSFHAKTAEAKYLRLKELGFDVNDKNYICASDKSLVKCSWLIDDNIINASNAHEAGVLFTRPWNKNFNFPIRCSSWNDVIRYFTGVS